MVEKFEKIEHDIYVTEKKLKAAENKKKALEQSVRKLTRNERTHRLCTRGGMLEAFLKQPTVLTDEDVMELLTFLFRSEEAQNKLCFLIEERVKEIESAEV
ncbi:MAG: DUF3847 domain-containing protein [Oscillospiraceae bacterium]|nr:DUF3847 domain-containing protein [Oscillospiraceae bacterium]